MSPLCLAPRLVLARVLTNDFLPTQLGINLQRAESLNDSPIFIRALADIVSTHMTDYSEGKCGPTSIQMGLRCPGCTNPRCESSKNFFANGGKVEQVAA